MGGEADGVGEACGVVGVAGADSFASHLLQLALMALQHRGQESAGIATSDGQDICIDKDMGLVSQIFSEHRLASLPGSVGIGHTRYSTSGSSVWSNAQPVLGGYGAKQFALAHNGNLVNAVHLGELLGLQGLDQFTDSDIVVRHVTKTMATMPSDEDVLVSSLLAVAPKLLGAYSFVILDRNRIMGMRDPQGFRPLCLGRLHDTWVLASETPALDVLGAQFVREVMPGELIVLTSGCDPVSFRFGTDPQPTASAMCVFEYVYFARPDGVLAGKGVHAARKRMGRALAWESPVPADVVIPVPDSSVPGAMGYSEETGIPFEDGFIKNRYIGRSFMAPNQELREAAVRVKLNVIRENVIGKRVVVVEDSIVRATTLLGTMKMLREAGAVEIHLRVLSPPYRWPCFFGMDTGKRDELIAANHSVEEIRKILGADSLAYLPYDAMVKAIEAPVGFCGACLTGEYPVPLPTLLKVRTDGGGSSKAPD